MAAFTPKPVDGVQYQGNANESEVAAFFGTDMGVAFIYTSEDILREPGKNTYIVLTAAELAAQYDLVL